MRIAVVLALTVGVSCASGTTSESARPSASATPTIAPTFVQAPVGTARSSAATLQPTPTGSLPIASGTPSQRPIVAASAPPPAAPAATASTTPPTPPPQAGPVMWSDDAQGRWAAQGTPPACPAQPMLVMPTSLAKAVSVLYPGQYRPEYKPHGGLRYDGAPNAIEVRAPADMYVWRGARYPVGALPGVSDPNEMQYTFDFQMPCGVMIRIGHLRKLSPRFQALAERFPLPTTPDSRTTGVAPSLVRKGELIATEIGLSGNVFYDLGVFDLRAPNAASRSAAYAARHLAEDGPRWLSLAGHAVCWLREWIPASESAVLNALPGTAPSFKTSDYCG